MKRILAILFSILYLGVGIVSIFHAIEFFGIANESWMAITLAIVFEIGQAALLCHILLTRTKNAMPWILMCVLTAVQVIGNVFSSYQYSVLHSPEQIKYFTDSVLFFVADPNPQVNQVIISYIVGAILPIVALCMSSMVVDVLGVKQPEPEPEPEKIPQKPQVFL